MNESQATCRLAAFHERPRFPGPLGEALEHRGAGRARGPILPQNFVEGRCL